MLRNKKKRKKQFPITFKFRKQVYKSNKNRFLWFHFFTNHKNRLNKIKYINISFECAKYKCLIFILTARKNHWFSAGLHSTASLFFFFLILDFTYPNNKIEQCEDVWTYTLFTKTTKTFSYKNVNVYSQTILYYMPIDFWRQWERWKNKI